MPALLSVWKPLAFGAPELIVILVILLVFFSGHAVPAEGRHSNRGSRLSRGEVLFLLCLATVLAISCGIVLVRQFAR